MKKIFTLIVLSFIISIVIAQQNPNARNCTINDAVITVQDISLCPSNSGTDIFIAVSDPGITYYLRDDSNDDTIAGPMLGDGSQLTFNTGAILTTTTYNVIASGTATALVYDGIDDMVDCGPDPLTGDFTLECWVNHTVNTFYPA